MSQAERKNQTREAIVEYLNAYFPGAAVDERAGDAPGSEPDIHYSFRVDVDPKPLRVYVTVEALDMLADSQGGPAAVPTWFDEQEVAGILQQGHEVYVMQGGAQGMIEAP